MTRRGYLGTHRTRHPGSPRGVRDKADATYPRLHRLPQHAFLNAAWHRTPRRGRRANPVILAILTASIGIYRCGLLRPSSRNGMTGVEGGASPRATDGAAECLGPAIFQGNKIGDFREPSLR